MDLDVVNNFPGGKPVQLCPPPANQRCIVWSSNHYPDRLFRRDGDRHSDIFKTTGSAWQVTYRGQGSWVTQGSPNGDPINNIALGDFNNDGKTDAFRTMTVTGNCLVGNPPVPGPGWVASYSRPNNPPQLSDPFGVWSPLRCTSIVTLSDLGFGDFDGDGKTDVIQASGVSPWCGPGPGLEISYGGTGSWTTLLCTSATLPSIALADFNGDGKTDIFRNTSDGNCGGGSKFWHISYGGTGPWTQVNCSTAAFADMAFRDFDNDGQTDVFAASGSDWKRIDGGIGTWIFMRNAFELVNTLGFGDFNGDGNADVFDPEPGPDIWYVSYGGTSNWSTLNQKPEDLPQLLLGMRDRG